MYDKLAGMTGTAAHRSGGVPAIYDLEVVAIPTNGPSSAMTIPTWSTRPSGPSSTPSCKRSRTRTSGASPCSWAPRHRDLGVLSDLLRRHGIEHNVLNAKNHEREAVIIAQAGRPGAVTIATNMAGRGVDILLGGNAENLARDELRKQGYDLNEVTEQDWNEAIDMLRRGEDPTEEISAPWVDVLVQSWRQVQGGSAERCGKRAASTSSAPSATRPGASTTSCAAVPAARATQASPASIFP